MRNRFLIITLLSALFIGSFLPTVSAQALLKGDVLTVSENDYKIVTEKGLVLVDYWAPWCPPCRKMNPILKEIAEERADKVTIAKLNVDNNKSFSEKMQVQSLPTIVVYQDGKELGRIVGQQPKEKLLEVIDGLYAEAQKNNQNAKKE